MGLLSKIATYIYGGDMYEQYLMRQRDFENRLTALSDDALAARICKLAATLRNPAPNYTDPQGQKSHNTRNQEFYTALTVMRNRVVADGIAQHADLEKIMRAAGAVDPADQHNAQTMAKAIISATTENKWAQALQP